MSAVLESLNIDKSFFVQFAIVIVLFLSLKHFLFEKLLEVIQNRENSTTGLLQKSKEKEEESLKISSEIETQIIDIKNELSHELKSVKNQLLTQKEKEYKELELRLDSEYSNKRDSFEKELDENFNVIKAKTKSLATDLVEKIIQ